MSKDYPNARDCPHGRQWGKCDTCDMLEALAELNTLHAENERLRRIEAAAKVLRQDAGAANVVLVESQNVTAAFGVLNLALTQYDAALAAGKGE